jgi:TfoX/Sxy family transcriptional regulator of competence genes
MFGEYALYLEGRVVAFVCDNQVFIKPTAAGARLAPGAVPLPPYPGGKPHLRLADELDDRELFKRILIATASELPLPKPKPKPKAKPAARGAR